MWKMYGDDFEGLALVFNAQELITSSEPQAMVVSPKNNSSIKVLLQKQNNETKDNFPTPVLYKIYYLDKSLEGNTKDDNVIAALQEIKKWYDDSENESCKKYANLLLQEISHLIKDKTYKYENEYRLIYFANSQVVKDSVKHDKDNNSLYMEHKECPVPQEVLLGPKISIKNELYCDYALKKLGKDKDIPIVKSEIQYR